MVCIKLACLDNAWAFCRFILQGQWKSTVMWEHVTPQKLFFWPFIHSFIIQDSSIDNDVQKEHLYCPWWLTAVTELDLHPSINISSSSWSHVKPGVDSVPSLVWLYWSLMYAIYMLLYIVYITICFILTPITWPDSCSNTVQMWPSGSLIKLKYQM